VLLLVTRQVLAPGKRTVALRVMGLGETRDFALYHFVLSRARAHFSGGACGSGFRRPVPRVVRVLGVPALLP
jgi:hypothetical protein